MKKILFTLFSLVFAIGLFAQQAPPQGINYQAMVYVPYGNQCAGVNSSGQLAANTKQVVVKFTITEGYNGPIKYEETITDTTDQYGLLSTVIGTGTPTSLSPGLFNQIDWSLGNPYLKVKITLTQYNSSVSSNQKLWSVPYALYADEANSADYATNSGYADSSDFAEMAGNGITGVSDNGNGTLTFTYYDGSTYTTGVLSGLMGQQGPAGQNGANGQSAYDIWLAQGNTGTVADFLISLQGAPGTPGQQGVPGPQGLTGATGATGAQGPAGATGASGPTGPQGLTGATGATGAQGPIGLTGLTGATGATGPQGPIGLTGSTGAQGPNGAAGTNGKNTLVKTTTETVGVNCATGGVKLEYGLDANSNSVLDAGEINASLTKYVCNGAVGATGSQGIQGPQGIQGIQGPAGTSGSQNAWSLTGNAGTNPTTNFIGTTDAQDWAIKTNNIERMRITSVGNVGIGTSTPNYSLLGNTTHLGQIITNTNGSAALQLESYRNAGNHSKIAAFNYRGTSGTPQNLQDGDELLQIGGYGYNGPNDAFYGLGCRIIFGVDGTPSLNSTPGFLDFRTRKLGDASDLSRMFINSDGNVGIGTQTPVGKFNISNDVTGSDSSFVVTTAGNVGIGTTSPVGKFHLVDNAGSLYRDFGGTTWISRSSGNVLFLTNSSNSTTNTSILTFQRGDGTGTDAAFLTNSDGVNGVNAFSFSIGGAIRQVWHSNGNVGIGTTAPARTLHVNAVMRLEPIATAPASPAKGDMYFDSTLNRLRVYDGTVWQNCW